MNVFDNKDLHQSYKKIKSFVDSMVATEETTIPLTYLIQALYPKAFENFQNFMKQQYTLGYSQAIEDMKNKENK